MDMITGEKLIRNLRDSDILIYRGSINTGKYLLYS